MVVLLLHGFVPARGLRICDGLAEAIATALLFLLISLASGWISEKTARLSVVYGSLTTSLVFLYSVYLYSSALLLGAEIAAAWSRLQTVDGEPILTQVKRAVLGPFVSQKESPVDKPMPDATPDAASGPCSMPPSSRLTRFFAARSRIFQPTPEEPVNVISFTRSSSTRTSPISDAGPTRTFSQPGGSPASSTASAKT